MHFRKIYVRGNRRAVKAVFQQIRLHRAVGLKGPAYAHLLLVLYGALIYDAEPHVRSLAVYREAVGGRQGRAAQAKPGPFLPCKMQVKVPGGEQARGMLRLPGNRRRLLRQVCLRRRSRLTQAGGQRQGRADIVLGLDGFFRAGRKDRRRQKRRQQAQGQQHTEDLLRFHSLHLCFFTSFVKRSFFLAIIPQYHCYASHGNKKNCGRLERSSLLQYDHLPDAVTHKANEYPTKQTFTLEARPQRGLKAEKARPGNGSGTGCFTP